MDGLCMMNKKKTMSTGLMQITNGYDYLRIGANLHHIQFTIEIQYK